MEVTREEALKWAEAHRENTIRELDKLIDNLIGSRSRLQKGVGFYLSGNPEILLRQAMDEASRAEAVAMFADVGRY